LIGKAVVVEPTHPEITIGGRKRLCQLLKLFAVHKQPGNTLKDNFCGPKTVAQTVDIFGQFGWGHRKLSRKEFVYPA
jgi:hypothetical protein